MGWRAFIASVLQTVSWPLVVVYLARRFGKPLAALVAGQRLARLKAAGVEAELSAAENAVEKAGGMLPAPQPVLVETASPVQALPAPSVPADLVQHDKSAAIVALYTQFEDFLANAVGRAGLARPGLSAGARSLGEYLARNEVIARPTFDAIDAIATVRNAAVFASETSLTEEQVEKYALAVRHAIVLVGQEVDTYLNARSSERGSATSRG